MKTRTSIYTRPFAYVLLVAVIFCSCGEQSPKKVERKCVLTIRNGSGWGSGSSSVECDSFQMQGTRKAFVWVNGYKMNIEAENVIYPHVR
jgi:hypothetical protein